MRTRIRILGYSPVTSVSTLNPPEPEPGWVRIRSQIQGFDDQKFNILQLKKKFKFKFRMENLYSQVSVEGFQSTGEASKPPERNPALRNDMKLFQKLPDLVLK